MKYLRELKKSKNAYPDPLQKLQKDPSYSSCSSEREHIFEKQEVCDLDSCAVPEAETTMNEHCRPRCYHCSKFGPIGAEAGCSKPGDPKFSMAALIECREQFA